MKKRLVAGAFAVGAMLAVGAETPTCPLPGEWELDEAVSDEFDGKTFDRTKWWNYLPGFPARMTYFNHGRNVEQKGGELILTCRREPEENLPFGWLEEGREPYSCGAAKSRRKAYLGYFEARMKGNSAAVRSAFWLYDPLSTQPRLKYSPGNVSEEIDICEIAGRHQKEDADMPYEVSLFTHHYITPYYEGVCNFMNTPLGFYKKLPFDPTADYHVYGLLWTKEEIVWYVDNQEYGRMTNTAFGGGGFPRPLHVVFDCEMIDGWNGCRCKTIDRATLPGTTRVDWFRHWLPKDARKRTIDVPKPAVPVKLDGNGSDAAWETAADPSDLLLLRRSGAEPASVPPCLSTEVKVLADDESFTFLVTAEEWAMAKRKLEATMPDGPAWGDDGVELCLQPPGTDSYYHIAVNAAGVVYDARCPGNDKTCDLGVTAKAGTSPTGWVLEIRVPAKGMRPLVRGEKWGFHFHRNVYSRGVLESVALNGAGAHDVSSFVPLAIK